MVQPDLEEKIYRRELPVWLHEVETALLVTEISVLDTEEGIRSGTCCMSLPGTVTPVKPTCLT